jgi:hypothetical protein
METTAAPTTPALETGESLFATPVTTDAAVRAVAGAAAAAPAVEPPHAPLAATVPPLVGLVRAQVVPAAVSATTRRLSLPRNGATVGGFRVVAMTDVDVLIEILAPPWALGEMPSDVTVGGGTTASSAGAGGATVVGVADPPQTPRDDAVTGATEPASAMELFRAACGAPRADSPTGPAEDEVHGVGDDAHAPDQSSPIPPTAGSPADAVSAASDASPSAGDDATAPALGVPSDAPAGGDDDEVHGDKTAAIWIAPQQACADCGRGLPVAGQQCFDYDGDLLCTDCVLLRAGVDLR